MHEHTSTTWHKSTYSGGNGGHCVEARELETGAHVRDSMHRHEGHLTFPSAEWAALLGFTRQTSD